MSGCDFSIPGESQNCEYDLSVALVVCLVSVRLSCLSTVRGDADILGNEREMVQIRCPEDYDNLPPQLLNSKETQQQK